MYFWKALSLLPAGMFRPEVYAWGLKELGYSYSEVFIFSFLAACLYALCFFILFSFPNLFRKKEKRKKHNVWAERIMGWLNKRGLTILTPIAIFILSAIPLPSLETIGVVMAKMTDYPKTSLAIIFVGSLLKTYLTLNVVF
jgi:hypothetical protein